MDPPHGGSVVVCVCVCVLITLWVGMASLSSSGTPAPQGGGEEYKFNIAASHTKFNILRCPENPAKLKIYRDRICLITLAGEARGKF